MSDKLFYWVFQSNPDWILDLQPDLVAAAGLAGDAAGDAAGAAGSAAGYRFSAPVLKEREYRLDGLFLPPPQLPELPAVILEAQMAADPGFLRRLYAESARWLQQASNIDHCPRRWRSLCGSGCIGSNWSPPPPIQRPRRCCGPWRCWCSPWPMSSPLS